MSYGARPRDSVIQILGSATDSITQAIIPPVNSALRQDVGERNVKVHRVAFSVGEVFNASETALSHFLNPAFFSGARDFDSFARVSVGHYFVDLHAVFSSHSSSSSGTRRAGNPRPRILSTMCITELPAIASHSLSVNSR